MATTSNIVVDNNWTLVLSGPTSEAASIEAVSLSAQIAMSENLPAASLVGFRMNPSETYNFTLNTGENLYAKSDTGSVELVLNS